MSCVVRLRLQDALNNHHNSLVCTQSAPLSISFFHQHELHHFLAPAPSSGISAHPTTCVLNSNGRYSERAKSSCSTKSNQPTSTRTRLACPRAPDQIHHPRLSSSIKPSFPSLLWHLSWVLRPAEAPNTPTPLPRLMRAQGWILFRKTCLAEDLQH